MVRREKIPELVLKREDAIGEQLTPQQLSDKADLYIAQRAKEDRPFFSKTTEGAEKWKRSEDKRTDAESAANIEMLRHNIWLAQEIFIKIWVECMDEIIMIHNVPVKEAFKPSRFKLTKPVHPIDGPNKVPFLEAQRAIESIQPDHTSDTYESYLGTLMKEIERRWHQEHAELKDKMEFRPANEN